MEGLLEFLESVRTQGLDQGNLLGLLNVCIGRRIRRPDGTVVSNGVTWRELASLLRQVRWDPQTVRELGLDPSALPPRDREKFWYSAILQAHVDSPAATQAGNRLAALVAADYVVSGAPGSGGGAAT